MQFQALFMDKINVIFVIKGIWIGALAFTTLKANSADNKLVMFLIVKT